MKNVKLGTNLCVVGMKGDTKVFGVIKAKDLNQQSLKNDYSPCSYDVELLERMIQLVRAMEVYSNEKLDILVPKKKMGPLLMKSRETGQVYCLAPRTTVYFVDEA